MVDIESITIKLTTGEMVEIESWDRPYVHMHIGPTTITYRNFLEALKDLENVNYDTSKMVPQI